MTTLALFRRRDAAPLEADLEGEVVLDTWIEAVSVDAGDVIVRQGEFADAFYVITEGEFTVLLDGSPRPVPLTTLGPGDCFGETGLLTTRTRTAGVVAASAGQLVVLGESELRTILTDAQLRGTDLGTAASQFVAALDWEPVSA